MKSICFVFLFVGHSMVSAQSLSGSPEDDAVCQRYALARLIALMDPYARSSHVKTCMGNYNCAELGLGSVCCDLGGEKRIFRCFGGTKRAQPSACMNAKNFQKMYQPELYGLNYVPCQENWDCPTQTIGSSYCCPDDFDPSYCVERKS